MRLKPLQQEKEINEALDSRPYTGIFIIGAVTKSCGAFLLSGYVERDNPDTI